MGMSDKLGFMRRLNHLPAMTREDMANLIHISDG
jgi:hypothetical protein